MTQWKFLHLFGFTMGFNPLGSALSDNETWYEMKVEEIPNADFLVSVNSPSFASSISVNVVTRFVDDAIVYL